MSEKENQDSFLNRWSSRKRDAAAQVEVVEQEATITSTPLPMPAGLEQDEAALAEFAVTSDIGEQAQAVDTSSVSNDMEASDALEEPLLSDADMPPIESLTADSDVSGFFNKGVSAALRKAALRYVFQLPRFNVRDGLNDYDGDYTVFEPLGGIITSDMKFHAARKERDQRAAEAEREEEILRQQQLEDESEAVRKAEKNDEDASDEESLVENEPSSQPGAEGDVEADSENDSENEVTTLAHAEGDAGLDQQPQTAVEKIEQV